MFPDSDSGGSYVVAVSLSNVQSSLRHLALIELIVSVGVLVMLAGLAWLVVKLGLRPLARMEGTAKEIAAGDLTRRVQPATEKTEVGRLGLALNSMLAQIERAFNERQRSELRMRRFLADASHELRTPLSAIRGYAELFRIGAASDSEHRERAMRRIEDESTRMGGLVNDLLTLARLEEVRERNRVELDLVQIVAEAVEDTRVAARDRVISFKSPGSLPMLGDSDQLRQVIGNLLANAVRHTPPGTPVEVHLARHLHEAVLVVRDFGPGLAPGTEAQVFGRFWRASESRSRKGGGSGLGLAVVAAVVEAHGGEVRAENAAEGGARFEVSLPLDTARDGIEGPDHRSVRPDRGERSDLTVSSP